MMRGFKELEVGSTARRKPDISNSKPNSPLNSHWTPSKVLISCSKPSINRRSKTCNLRMLRVIKLLQPSRFSKHMHLRIRPRTHFKSNRHKWSNYTRRSMMRDATTQILPGVLLMTPAWSLKRCAISVALLEAGRNFCPVLSAEKASIHTVFNYFLPMGLTMTNLLQRWWQRKKS